MRTIIRDNYDPQLGAYHERLVIDEARHKKWLFDCDGVFTDITNPLVVSERGESEDFAASQKWVTEIDDKVDGLAEDLGDEIQTRTDADNAIWAEIEEIEMSSDVVDVVGTYAELQQYDTSHLNDNDIIKVLQDETHQNETSYYRWDTSTDTFSYVGSEGPYYTESEVDALLAGKQDTLIAGANIQIAADGKTISATDTTYTAGTGLNLTGTTFSVDTTAVQEKLTAGSNIQITNNVISATDTTYTPFTGATSSVDGAQGLVPAPLAGDQDKVLKGNGTWGTISTGPTVVQTTGQSTSSVMSQKATTDMIFNPDNGAIQIGAVYADNDCVAIGDGAEFRDAVHGVAIGKDTYVDSDGGIAIGSYAECSQNGGIAIGDGSVLNNDDDNRYPNDVLSIGNSDPLQTRKRVIINVGEPEQNSDAATKGYVDTAVASAATTVVQTTGQSTSSVMSQKAVTDIIGDIETALQILNSGAGVP